MRNRLLLVALAASLCLSAVPVVSAVAAVQVPTTSSSSAAVSGSAVVAEAERFVGYPYAYTGDSPSTGFSCIGFVWYVYGQLGESIPGTLGTAMAAFPRVSENNLLPGDIIFFQNTWWPGVSHVAIYIGGGKIVHAANPQYGVTISSLVNDPRDGDYWQQHYLVAERPWTGAASTGGGGYKHHRTHIVYVSASSLNLRSGASLSDSVVEVLSHGTKLRIEGWTPGWARVRTMNGTLGWVLRDGISRQPGTFSNVGGGQRHHGHGHGHGVAVGVRRAAWHKGKTIYVSALRVHSSPSVSAPVIATLVRGNRVGILAHEPGWDKILMKNGTIGWSMSRYVGSHRAGSRRPSHHRRRAGHTPLRYGVNVHSYPNMRSSVVTVSNGKPVHVLRWTARWVDVRLSTGARGWVWRAFVGNIRITSSSRHVSHHRRHHKSNQNLRTTFSGGYAVVSGVRIHSKPRFAAPVISGTTSGMRVRILGYHGRFAHILTSTGVRGWMEARYISGATRQSAAVRSGRSTARGNGGSTGKYGTHVTVTVRIHARPSLQGRVIGLVYQGNHVTVLRDVSGWDLVRLHNGRTGYVDSAYIAG